MKHREEDEVEIAMLVLVERVRKVSRGRSQLLMWRALSSLDPFAWSVLGAAIGMWVGGLLAYLLGGGYLAVLVLAGVLGGASAGAGYGGGWLVHHLATNGCQRSAARVRWVNRYSWPLWLRLVSVAAALGVIFSFWGLTTIY